MDISIKLLTFGAAMIFFVLWFIDEIISFRRIKKYGIGCGRGSNPAITWLVTHKSRKFIYIKVITYAIMVLILAEVIKKYIEYLHFVTLIFIIIYLLFDLKVSRKYVCSTTNPPN